MKRFVRPWREKLADAARRMATLGLVQGSSGNVSLRLDEAILITPSGIPYEWLHPQQVVAIDGEGRRIWGVGAPSSEWRMHVAVYRARSDVTAIVHTHSPYATAASFGDSLRVLHDEGRLLFGEEVAVSRHAPPGTWELAEAVAQALGHGTAVLVGRHGALAVGRTLTEALLHAEKLEEAARLRFLVERDTGHG